MFEGSMWSVFESICTGLCLCTLYVSSCLCSKDLCGLWLSLYVQDCVCVHCTYQAVYVQRIYVVYDWVYMYRIASVYTVPVYVSIWLWAFLCMSVYASMFKRTVSGLCTFLCIFLCMYVFGPCIFPVNCVYLCVPLSQCCLGICLCVYLSIIVLLFCFFLQDNTCTSSSNE